MKTIDINADIGEGFPFDAEILSYISSCNIATGGHVGNKNTILSTIQLAKKNDVKIGAHPSYPDTKNFGRYSIDISNQDLIKSIDKQLKDFNNCILKTKAKWVHIKFHGALYNDLTVDKLKAELIVDYLFKKYPEKVLVVPPNSELQKIASNSLQTKVEGFADRAYNEDLSLVSRFIKNAVITESSQVLNQVLDMVLHQKVSTVQNNEKAIKVDTICFHGDTPKAILLVKTIVESLNHHNIIIE